MQSRPYPRVARPLAFRCDLSFRPDSYLAPSDPAAAILAEAAGWPAPPGARAGAGAGDGADVGVAIATIRFGRPGTVGTSGAVGASALAGAPGAVDTHVVEIRATPRGSHVTYAIVDDFGTAYRPFHPVSSEPLTLGAVAELIEESERVSDGPRLDGSERGVVLHVLDTVFGFASGRDARRETAGARSALVDAVRAFVQVESELYPGLDRYLEERIDEWLVSKGCLSAPPYGARIAARFPASRPGREPVSSRVPASCVVAGPQADAIDRVVRAWWRSRSAPSDVEAALDLGRNAARLRSALRREVSRTGRLPEGRFEVGSGAKGFEGGSGIESFEVDMDDLADA